MQVNMVSTYPPSRCGIAFYVKRLIQELKSFKRVIARINKIPIDLGKVNNPLYFLQLAGRAKRADVIHIQYDYSFFKNMDLPGILSIFCAPGIYTILFYLRLKYPHKPAILTTMHEVIDTAKRCKNLPLLSYTIILHKFIFWISDKIIVHTDKSKNMLVRQNVERGKIIKLPHASYDHPAILEKRRSKVKLNLKDRKVILLFGFIHHNKGYEQVIDVIARLSREVVVLICGEAKAQHRTYLEFLKNKVNELGIQDRVLFYGYVDDKDLPSIFSSADLAILPYRVTEQSGVLAHVLSYGLPVLASDIESFREVKTDYDCIELFKFDDRKELLEKIKILLGDRSKRDQLIKNIDNYIRETNFRAVARKHMGLYYELTQGGHPDSIYDSTMQRERIDWLKANKKGKTLEIGCATGYVTEYVKADIGVDSDNFRVRVAQRNHPSQRFLVAEASDLPFRDSQFDTVMIPEVLEHVPFDNARRVLVECLRVSKEQLLVTLPNASKKNYDKAVVETGEHLWMPTEENVSRLLGGRDCQIQYTSDSDFVLITISRRRVRKSESN